MTAWTRDLISALIGLWIVTGIYIDGWAHVNLIDAIETFFTPWHATFYSGLVAFVIWIAVLCLRLRQSGDSALQVLKKLPVGYQSGLAGAAIFATGGAIDMFWHELIGIEKSIDALLSPPHLVLLTGVLLMATTAWRSQRATSTRATVPELISLTSVVAISAFFVNYLAPFGWAAPLLAYVENENEGTVATWIGGLIVFSVLFLVPLLWQLRDGRFRPGTLTAFTLAVGLGVIYAMSEGWDKGLLLAGLIGSLAGAITVDVLLAQPGWRAWRYGLPAMMGLTSFLVWTGQFIGYALAQPVLWPVTLWGGALIIAAGTGAALGAVAWHPPAEIPARAKQRAPDRPIEAIQAASAPAPRHESAPPDRSAA